MKIWTIKEAEKFEEVLDRCPDTLWAVTPSGEQYDLKNPQERVKAIALMLQADGADEPELFAGSYKNESILYPFILSQRPRVA